MKRDAIAAFYTISCVPRVFQFLLPKHTVRNALHMLVHLSYLTLVFINKVPDHRSKEQHFRVWSVSLWKNGDTQNKQTKLVLASNTCLPYTWQP